MIGWDRRKFDKICSGLRLRLDYKLNKDALRVLETVIKELEYEMCFPFNEKAIILDIGGHYGYFSFFASMNLKPESQIFSIEPSPGNVEVFKQNLKSNDFNNIKLIQCGLGGKTMRTELYEGNSYNHSIINNNIKKAIAIVQIYSLDDFLIQNSLNKIDFLKLDCEGAEYDILFNTSGNGFEKIKIISMEFHDQRALGHTPNQLIELLQDNRFKIVKFQYDEDTSLNNLNFGKIVAVKL